MLANIFLLSTAQLMFFWVKLVYLTPVSISQHLVNNTLGSMKPTIRTSFSVIFKRVVSASLDRLLSLFMSGKICSSASGLMDSRREY